MAFFSASFRFGCLTENTIFNYSFSSALLFIHSFGHSLVTAQLKVLSWWCDFVFFLLPSSYNFSTNIFRHRLVWVLTTVQCAVCHVECVCVCYITTEKSHLQFSDNNFFPLIHRVSKPVKAHWLENQCMSVIVGYSIFVVAQQTYNRCVCVGCLCIKCKYYNISCSN